MSQFLRTDDTIKRIVRVRLERKVDEYPDLSYLGEYSDRPEEVHIDRKERGDMGRGEYRYFNAGCGDPAYIEQDYERHERYNRGDWCVLFLQAVAKVSINGVTQTVTSGGLNGVESDSDKTYIGEIMAEELDELRGILESMGFAAEQIDEAFQQAEGLDL